MKNTRFIPIFIFIFIAIFIIGEMAIRYFRPDIRLHLEPIYMSKELHHNYMPGYKWYFENKIEDGGEWIELVTNDLGIRGDTIKAASPDVYRILILGDSFIQADEIAFEDTIGEQIEKILFPQHVEVIQHGISSWAPLLALNWYNKIGRNFKPEIVILQICINDFSELYANSDVNYTRVVEWDEEGLPTIFNVQEYKPNPIKVFLRKHSRIMLAISMLKERYLGYKEDGSRKKPQRIKTISQEEIDELSNKDPKEFEKRVNALFNREDLAEFLILYAGPQYWNERVKVNVEESMQYIRRLNQLIIEDGGVLVVIDAPLGWTVGPSECKVGKKKVYNLMEDVMWPYGIGEYLKKRFSEMGIRFVDLQGRLSEISDGTIYNNADIHWSKNGHRKIAEILAGEIVKIVK